MLKVKMSITGTKATSAKLRRAAGILQDFTMEMTTVMDYLASQFEGPTAPVFASRGGIIGESWPALKPSYEFWKRKKFSGAGVLVRSQTMSKSYTKTIGRNSAKLTNTAKYAYRHQDGDGPPQRIFMKIGTEQEKEVITMFKTGLLRRLTTALS